MLPSAPARKLAVVACMDARLNPSELLGLAAGDAHVIRNAGGVITDDAIRSLAISQRLLGTEEIVLVQHTDCGMLGLDEREFTRTLEADAGFEPPWDIGAFDDLERSVRESIARIEASPFLPCRDRVRGLIYDVATGRVREVRG
jgi:carbonic anhydrase